MKSWGLVLSGGTAWGIANAGVIEVLEREELHPNYIAGSSMGAVVAALYALGHPASVMQELCKKICLQNIAKWDGKPFEGGLHGGMLRHCILEHLEPLIGDAQIKDCNIPFICVAGRVRSPVEWKRIIKAGFVEYMHEHVEPYVFPPATKVLDAVMASTAIPILFKPATVGKDTFIDLLTLGSVPVHELRKHCKPDIVIATDTNDRRVVVRSLLPAGFRQFYDEGITLLDDNLKASDLVIRPSISWGSYRFDKAMQIYASGKKEAEEKLPEIRRLVLSF